MKVSNSMIVSEQMLYNRKIKIDPNEAFQSLITKLKFVSIEMTNAMDELRKEAQESLWMQSKVNFNELEIMQNFLNKTKNKNDEATFLKLLLLT